MRNFLNATAAINALDSTRSDWVALLNRLVALEQHSLGLFSLKTDTASVLFLQDYANSEGRDGQASAQAILDAIVRQPHAYPVIFYSNFGSKLANVNSVRDSDPQNRFLLYPNPTSGLFEVKAGYLNAKLQRCIVRDISGRVISTHHIKSQEPVVIDLSVFENGIYLVSLEDEMNRTVYNAKMIKN